MAMAIHSEFGFRKKSILCQFGNFFAHQNVIEFFLSKAVLSAVPPPYQMHSISNTVSYDLTHYRTYGICFYFLRFPSTVLPIGCLYHHNKTLLRGHTLISVSLLSFIASRTTILWNVFSTYMFRVLCVFPLSVRLSSRTHSHLARVNLDTY